MFMFWSKCTSSFQKEFCGLLRRMFSGSLSRPYKYAFPYPSLIKSSMLAEYFGGFKIIFVRL